MKDQTLYQWFAESEKAHPDETALEVQGVSVTYRTLCLTALTLAERLIAVHAGVPKRVALVASRTVAAYAGYLAIQRLGATVVPLSPEYPQERNLRIARLAEVDAVIAEDAYASALVDPDAPFRPSVLSVSPFELVSDDVDESLLPAEPTDTEAIAYILFTSGSTGRPKGVPVRQSSISALVAYNSVRYEVGPGCRASQVFGLTFDASVWDMFVTWGAGATLVVPSAHDLYRPVDFIVKHQLTHWFSVPSVVTMARLMGNLPLGEAVTLKHSIFGAEPVTVQQVDLWREVAPNTRIHNVYGPTETTITCTEYELSVDRSEWAHTSNGTVPIGHEYPHVEVVILGEDGLRADDGELCVRGQQRFIGYLDPADNEDRFLLFEDDGKPASTYSSGGLTDSHWYRTGDRICVENGRMLHRGRLDSQVKIMGHRVEIGEVEAALRRHPSVVEAAVIAATADGRTQLLAAFAGNPVRPTDLHHWMRKVVPLHMVPLRISHMDALPLNDNGKVDRRRLAELLTSCHLGPFG
ncbi:AMP-binding protein [Streptomyces rhizosphaericus]|uniref:D-alanine--poly(Phosphoribitol) ligase n=1 Tax=Streptomyces rhizosphaericus TaxID=114699 RepID=A0A6G4AVX1_9ACTN|nr:AMP-binding protein [Streptomyces rhizosphaericus]NEW77626.1 D-alanine--poly(phosphoribitol) ligase [Streptomyces rhizosphaericus]